MSFIWHHLAARIKHLDELFDYFLRKRNVGGGQGKKALQAQFGRVDLLRFHLLNSELVEKRKAVLAKVEPTDAFIALLRIFNRQLANCDGWVISNKQSHYLLGLANIGEDLVKEWVFWKVVKPEAEGPIAQLIEVGGDVGCVDEIGRLQWQFILFLR